MEWCVSAPQAAARGRVKASRCARLGRRTGPCEAPRGTAAVGRPGSRRASQPLIPEGRGAGGAVPLNHTKGQRAAAGGRACVCGWPFVLVVSIPSVAGRGLRLETWGALHPPARRDVSIPSDSPLGASCPRRAGDSGAGGPPRRLAGPVRHCTPVASPFPPFVGSGLTMPRGPPGCPKRRTTPFQTHRLGRNPTEQTG